MDNNAEANGLATNRVELIPRWLQQSLSMFFPNMITVRELLHDSRIRLSFYMPRNRMLSVFTKSFQCIFKGTGKSSSWHCFFFALERSTGKSYSTSTSFGRSSDCCLGFAVVRGKVSCSLKCSVQRSIFCCLPWIDSSFISYTVSLAKIRHPPISRADVNNLRSFPEAVATFIS